VKQYPEVLWHR